MKPCTAGTSSATTTTGDTMRTIVYIYFTLSLVGLSLVAFGIIWEIVEPATVWATGSIIVLSFIVAVLNVVTVGLSRHRERKEFKRSLEKMTEARKHLTHAQIDFDEAKRRGVGD